MSKAKKTKRSKKYSADNLYRRITETLNHARNVSKINNCKHIFETGKNYCSKCRYRLSNEPTKGGKV